MRPYTDDHHEALRVRIRAFAETLPRRGKGAADPRAALRALADASLLPLCVPAAHGGADAQVDSLSLVVAREELSFSSGLHDALFAVQGLASHCLVAAGSEELRRRWLPAVATGQAMAAFALTEAEAGSDLGAVATTARFVADATGEQARGDWILDGHKVFISNAGSAATNDSSETVLQTFRNRLARSNPDDFASIQRIRGDRIPSHRCSAR